jgi:hypothetical protein
LDYDVSMLEDIDLVVVIPTMMSVFLSYERFCFVASPSFLGAEIPGAGNFWPLQILAKSFVVQPAVRGVEILSGNFIRGPEIPPLGWKFHPGGQNFWVKIAVTVSFFCLPI